MATGAWARQSALYPRAVGPSFGIVRDLAPVVRFENPADCALCGLFISELLENT